MKRTTDSLANSHQSDSNSNKNSLSSKMNPDFNNFKRTKSNNDDKNKRSRSPTSNTTTSGSDSESNNNKNNNNNKISNHNNPFIHLYYSHFNDGTLKDEYVKSTRLIWDYYMKNAQTLDCFRKKIELKEALEEMLDGVFPYLGVYIVGSSANGFGTCNSDMDVCLVVSHEEINQKTEALWLLRLIGRALQKASFIKKLRVISAKVPIIKFHDSHNGIDCDINLNNPMGIRNTHLLKCYSEIDWRVKPLILNVKRWAKFQNINDASKQTISSYCLSLMTIFFLQNCNPPVVPVLQEIYKDTFDVDKDIRELKLTEKLPDWTSSNMKSLGELFAGFLDYYSNFDYSKIISVRTGEILPRSVIPRYELEGNHSQWKHLLLQEPFDLSNAARSVFDEYVFKKVLDVFRKSNKIHKETKNINDLLEQRFASFDNYGLGGGGGGFHRNNNHSRFNDSDSDY